MRVSTAPYASLLRPTRREPRPVVDTTSARCENSCGSILCRHPIAPGTIIGGTSDRIPDSIQEFLLLAIDFAVLPAVCSDRIGELVGLVIALIQQQIGMTGKTAFFQRFCL